MLKKKKEISIYIDEKLCKGCDICVELCGKDVFTVSKQINRQGYYVPIPTRPDRCTGCLICELICPELAVILEIKETLVKSENYKMQNEEGNTLPEKFSRKAAKKK